MRKFALFLLWNTVAWAEPMGLEPSLPTLDFCPAAYRRIFHDVSPNKNSVTKSRKERRVAVTTADSDAFLAQARHLLGDDVRPEGSEKRLQVRDVPSDPATMFITNSDYLPTFKATEGGKDIHKARIRIRSYFIVPKGTPVEEIKRDGQKYARSKIADGDDIFVKLEFKVGKPMEDVDTGELTDTPGVVDKPSITIRQADVDLLTASAESFKQNHKDVAKRAKEVTLTKGEKANLVNDPAEVDAMIARIGILHEQGWDTGRLQPQTNMAYVRDAYRVYFANPNGGAPLEVQITFDRDILQTYLRSGVEEKFAADDRIIELKIPEDFADKSDEELRGVGLGELADLRALYLGLTPIEGTKREAGKPRNMRRRNNGRATPPAAK